jgi:hypothetical protein
MATTESEHEMSETGYNGWTNHQTWCVNLWLDNDEGTYNAVREYAQELAERIDPEAGFTVSDAVYDMADWLKSFVEDLAEDTCPGVIEGASFVTDLFGSALSDVNWDEIARNDVEEMVSELAR